MHLYTEEACPWSPVCAQSLRQIMLCRTARSVAGRGVHAACRAVDLPAAHDKVSPAAPHALNIHRFLHRSKLSWNYLTSKGGSDKITSLTLEDIALGIKDGTYRRILVMVGAGISTDSGIPDFRSPTNGLYSKLEEYNLPYPQAIFELSYFLKEPHAFLHLSKELLPGRHLPNTAHYFLRLLSDKRLLIRIYTQNIDGLERAVGIPLDKLVEAHGSFTSSTCTRCLRTCPGKVFQDAILESRVPLCKLCGGLIKPDIVFFGEQLPPRFLMHLVDFPQAHLLLVIGTSLEVEPFASLVYEVKAPIPRVLINREAVGPFLSGHQGVNVSEIGEVTAGIKRFAQLLGWEHDLNEMEKAGKDGSDQM